MSIVEAPAGADFERLTAPLRRELTVHCYRLTGSAQDAEDLVQETYLRAWRGFGGFAGRSSVRVWLYRIATNVCLTALERRARLDLPAGLGGPGAEAAGPLALAGPGVRWVTPLPGGVAGPDPDPAAVVAGRGSVRLALVAALQRLPATQRAVLILRDVLAWPAGEVAQLLGLSAAAVHSALARARDGLRRAGVVEDGLREPSGGQARRLLDGYARAFAESDVDALLAVLREDVALEMPPHLTWFAGRGTVGAFLGRRVMPALGAVRLVPVVANGGPAFAMYAAGRLHALQLLTLAPGGIARIVSFNDPALFAGFKLPEVLS